MAIVSGYTITREQFEELADLMDNAPNLQVSAWPDHTITIDNGDTIFIEFVEEGFQPCFACGGPIHACDCAGEGTA